jgi:DNA-binding NarL/FixJ family response regulator
MIETPNLNQSSDCQDAIFAPSVVSEFRIKDLRYFVIALTSSLETSALTERILSPFLESLKVAEFTVMDQFALGNVTCVIVETHPDREEETVDFTTLLTARELQIATLVAQGLPNKKVAKRLKISEWTVATHLRRIFAKLHVDSRAAMVYRCAPLIQSLQHQANP